jgi:hypothetical protein
MHAVNEMLLQSWSPTPGKRDTDIIRLFPATPWRWHDASFADLRAEGGHIVSAKRGNNATTWFRITAGRDGALRIKDNFDGRSVSWKNGTPEKQDGLYQIKLRKGETIEGSLEKPATILAPPADLAEPVILAKPGGIQPNKLPLRIGADSQGNNRFQGGMSRVVVFPRVLDANEIAALAVSRDTKSENLKDCLVSLLFKDGKVINGVSAKHQPISHGGVAAAEDGGFTLTNDGFLEIPHASDLNCLNGVTLAAWIKPTAFPAGGMRLIDKTPVGAASAWMLDTYPGDGLRLIFRDPHLTVPAKLPLGQWTHVAATITRDGGAVIYQNGKPVAP